MRRHLLPLVLAAAGPAACEDDLSLGWQRARIALPSGPREVAFGRGIDGDLIVPAGGLGTVGACAPIADASGTRVSLAEGTPHPLEGGRLALLHQVQDTFAMVGDPSLVLATGDAGRWELAVVSSVDSSGAVLRRPLLGEYATEPGDGKRAQVCSVPEYHDVVVGAGAALQPGSAWDGAAGGVLAMAVSGSLVLGAGAALDASAHGFRGGRLNEVPPTAADVTAEETTPENGGGKGEGLDSRSYDRHGKGNYANGAGGGNSFNAGGGGGGSAGAGGGGGDQYSQLGGSNPGTRGRPGAAIGVLDGTLLFLGGGGGAGHADDGNGVVGGAGGGAMLVFARRVEGPGAVRANGESPPASGGNSGPTGEAGSGAGGGGWILLRTADLAEFTGTMEARGGTGGSTAIVADDDSWGPGGGGGGGLVRIEGASWGGAIDVSGGPAGLTSAGTYAATEGAAGGIFLAPDATWSLP